MNERFYITDTGLGLDTVSDEMYSFGDEEDFCRLFDKLNEQQSTINKLKSDIEETEISIKLFKDDIATKNKKIEEQQTIIKSKDKELERLYNYFKDYLKDEMSGNAFSEMWDFVKEDEKWEDE